MTAIARQSPITLGCTAELLKYRRVVYDPSNGLAYASATEEDLGVLNDNTKTSGLGSSTTAAVVVPNEAGETWMVSAGTIAIDDDIFAAADGKVSATPNGNYIGKSLSVATDGQYVRVLRKSKTFSNSYVTETKTAAFNIEAEDSGKGYDTTGAAGAVAGTLPAATVGLEYFFRVGAAQELRITPDGTETISLPSTGVPGAAGAYITANAVGETAHLKCIVDGTWSVFGSSGTWTAEP